uniref:NADH dehydrogenase subunit 4L n=1 Tax=Bisetocreagris titanium TaxID=2836860 RepID=A0A8F7KN03_9ARAC|nr:NADH dehydrogenase subunit 4L [Bisetocreagris titanium]
MLLFFTGLMVTLYKFKHLISVLMGFELMGLALIVLIQSMMSEINASLVFIYLSFLVGTSCLGLSLMIGYVRMIKSDLYFSINMSKL